MLLALLGLVLLVFTLKMVRRNGLNVMNSVKKVLIIAALITPMVANATVRMNVFVNGYQSVYKNETVGGVHYDSIVYQFVKLKDRGEFSNKAFDVRDSANKYSISYKTFNDQRNFDDILTGVMNGSFIGASDLRIQSTESLPKSKLLLLFRKNIPMTDYINRCIDGSLISHYSIRDGDLDATIDAGSKVHLKFKIDLDEHKIISSEQPTSTCTSSLIDSYKGLLDVEKLSPMVGAIVTAKAE